MKKHTKILLSLVVSLVCSLCLLGFTASAEPADNSPFSVDVTSVDFGEIEHGNEANLTREVKITNLTDHPLEITNYYSGPFEFSFSDVTIEAGGWAILEVKPFYCQQNYSGSITVNADNFSIDIPITGTTKHRYPPYESLDSENHSRSCLCGHQDGPHPHSFVCDGQNDSLASEATCTEPARAYRYCSECGFVDGTQTFAVGDALGHDTEPEINGYDSEHHYKYCPQCQTYVKIPHQFVEYIYNADATCLADGTETAQCTDCPFSHTRTAEGSQKQHTYDETAEWRYDRDGHFRVCTKCGTKDNYDHNMGYFVDDHAYVSEATCLSPAQYLLSCSDCGFVDYSSEPGFVGVPAEHLFGDYISNNDATCMDNCTETVSCEYGCGETHTREIPDSTVDHNYIHHPEGTVDATCTADAQEMWMCEWCGDSYMKTIEGTITGHRFSDYEIVDEASCMENATEIAYCDYDCGETDTREIPNSIVDHHYVHRPEGTVEPTCTTDAQSMWMCIWCRDSYMRTEEGTATGHSFSSYEIVEEASCMENAKEMAYCDVCGETDTREIPDSTVDHYYIFYPDGTVKATCTTDAQETWKCMWCGDSYMKTRAGTATGHSYGGDGYCTVCGHDSGVHTPDTGDTSHTYLWFVLTVLSATAFAAALMLKKRTQN